MYEPLNNSGQLSRLRARNGLRVSSSPAVGEYGRQQRLYRSLLGAVEALGDEGVRLLRERPAERQRRLSALTDRVLRLSDLHVRTAQALFDQQGLWPSVDFAYLPTHQRTQEHERLSKARIIEF